MVQVIEVISKLLRAKEAELERILPELLKALDTVELSLLTRLHNVAWSSRTVPLDWQTKEAV